MTTLKQVPIHTRAMLVNLSLSVWTARKYDKKVTAKVNSEHAAGRDAGRYNKYLLGDAPSYKAVGKLAGEARTTHYAQTLPWSDEGWRLLPSANFMQYSDLLRKLKEQFESACEEFYLDYPSLQANDRDRLNGMFDINDYPPIGELRRKFGFSLDFSPVPSEGDFRLDLPSDQLKQIEAATQTRVQQAATAAIQDAWNRLYKVVAHMHEKLADPQGIFRDTLIGNTSELCDVLKRLNFADDITLEGMRRKIEQELTTYSPDDLRNDYNVRKEATQKAEQILETMKGILA